MGLVIAERYIQRRWPHATTVAYIAALKAFDSPEWAWWGIGVVLALDWSLSLASYINDRHVSPMEMD